MRSGYAISAPKRTLSDLQREMDDLSSEERELLHKEMYGCATDTIIETNEMIQSALNEMETMLEDIIIRGQASGYGIDDSTISFYVRAYEANPSFVADPKLRIQFLRCELFHVKVIFVKQYAILKIGLMKERLKYLSDTAQYEY